MAITIKSASFNGLDCRVIDVQVDISNGLSTFSIVGLGDTSVQESKERVRGSIKNCGFKFPIIRKVINLAPAQLPKQGALFDLPIAVGILVAAKQISGEKLQNNLIVGELGLNGEVKKIRGALPIVHFAKKQNFHKIFLPRANAAEAAFVEGIEIYPIQNLSELTDYCLNKKDLKPIPPNTLFNAKFSNDDSILKIAGQDKAKRALLIAAAGQHNIIFHGSPGCGKTLLARSIKSLLPPLSLEEAIESSKIFSIAGLLDDDEPILKNRPFREIHHSASAAATIGGGTSTIQPGEISLAHNGILLMDEIAEFPRSILESLRQPLEDHYIHLSRAKFSGKLPSKFTLVATMNPCPCGYFGDEKIPCICSDTQVQNYQKKISGPIMDRFDIRIKVEKAAFKDIFHRVSTDSLEDLQARVSSALQIQNIRFKNQPKIHSNSEMELEDIKQLAGITPKALKLFHEGTKNLHYSNRAYIKIIRVARTIADLDSKPEIEERHIAEAMQYR